MLCKWNLRGRLGRTQKIWICVGLSHPSGLFSLSGLFESKSGNQWKNYESPVLFSGKLVFRYSANW